MIYPIEKNTGYPRDLSHIPTQLVFCEKNEIEQVGRSLPPRTAGRPGDEEGEQKEA
jgi:hypothetical protein